MCITINVSDDNGDLITRIYTKIEFKNYFGSEPERNVVDCSNNTECLCDCNLEDTFDRLGIGGYIVGVEYYTWHIQGISKKKVLISSDTSIEHMGYVDPYFGALELLQIDLYDNGALFVKGRSLSTGEFVIQPFNEDIERKLQKGGWGFMQG